MGGELLGIFIYMAGLVGVAIAAELIRAFIFGVALLWVGRALIRYYKR